MSIRKIWFAALLAAAGMAMSWPSMAQFDGLYIGGGFGRFKATETFEDPASSTTFTSGAEEHQGGWNVNAGLGGSVGPLHLAVEVSYTNQVGEVSARILGTDFSNALQEAAAVSIMPGIKFGSGGLVFVRLGATQATYKFSGGDSEKFDGVLLGIGMKQAVARHGAVFVEYQSYEMKTKDGLTPASSGVLLGIQFSTH